MQTFVCKNDTVYAVHLNVNTHDSNRYPREVTQIIQAVESLELNLSSNNWKQKLILMLVHVRCWIKATPVSQ